MVWPHETTQVSVLGPLQFLVYIYDVANFQFSPITDLDLFADMLLYKCIDSTEDVQQDNDLLSHWVSSNHLSLNPSKCKYMIVSRKRQQTECPVILLQGVPLEQADTFRYLGVIVSSDLSWTAHVKSICTKARKLVGLLYRRFHNDSGTNTLLELYMTLVRPHLEYAAPASRGSVYSQPVLLSKVAIYVF